MEHDQSINISHHFGTGTTLSLLSPFFFGFTTVCFSFCFVFLSNQIFPLATFLTLIGPLYCWAPSSPSVHNVHTIKTSNVILHSLKWSTSCTVPDVHLNEEAMRVFLPTHSRTVAQCEDKEPTEHSTVCVCLFVLFVFLCAAVNCENLVLFWLSNIFF